MNPVDIAVIGTGPGGVSAAITGKIRGKSILLFGSRRLSEKMQKAQKILNYPGLPAVSGSEMADTMLNQLDSLDIPILEKQVSAVYAMPGFFAIQTAEELFDAKTVILAAGVVTGKPLPGEDRFLGRGVSYCATCDGMLYRGKTVALVGNNREAEEDAKFLEDIGCKVLRFAENGRYEISGGVKADTLKFRGQEYKVDCVFIIKDTVSVTRLVPGLNYEKGGIVTDRHMATNLPGVFAAGDCTGKPYQLAKAVGEGNIAALSACEYLDSTK